MGIIETVIIVREDHPDGCVRINKSDMQPDDVLFGENDGPKEGPKEGTVPWLKLQLDNAGVDYPAGANKADLAALCEGLTE